MQTILNASPLASVPGFENIISSLSTAIASVNTQIWSTQNTGDLFGDGRSIMLVAQDNLNSSLDELAASPSDAVAGQIAQAYSGANLTSLETSAYYLFLLLILQLELVLTFYHQLTKQQ